MSEDYVLARGSAGAHLLGTSHSGSLYGNLNAGSIFNGALGKTTEVVLDRAVAVPASLLAANHAESYSLDVVGSGEQGIAVLAIAPSTTASGGTHFKTAINGFAVTSALSAFPTQYQAVGVAGQGSTTGTVAQGSVAGVSGQGTVSSGTDATANGIVGTVVNSGTAVTTVNTALSKVVCQLQSAGVAKNTAFLYAIKQGGGAIAAINCAHGVLVDGASVDANAFAVTSGTTPTVLWGIGPAGQQTVAVTAPGAGGGPFAGGSATNITVSLTGLTTLAQALSAAITVNTTAVTANSRIWAQVISYAYGAAGAMAAGWPAVSLGSIVASTSFTFQIANLGTGALSGAIGIAFKIEN